MLIEDVFYVFYVSSVRMFGIMNDFIAYYRVGYIRVGLEDCVFIVNGD